MHAIIIGLSLGVASALPAGIVYVSSLGNHEVLRYDAGTGAYIDTFLTAGSGGLNQPHGILERCGDVLVCSFGNDRILRFDRSSGAFLDIFADSITGLDNPVYLRFGPDGNLYVSSQGSDQILRYTSSGAFVDAFVSAGSGGLDGPSGFAFGPDNRLYVAGRYSANVIAYNAATGAFDEVVADASDGLGVGTTFGLNFGDNGDLYFASNGSVFRYDLNSSAIIATIPLGSAIGIEPGPIGGIYVATANNLRLIDTGNNSVSSPRMTGGTINTLNFFRFPATGPSPGCANIPAVSTWGAIALSILVLVAGLLVFRARATSPS